jgi:hypothetical protein
MAEEIYGTVHTYWPTFLAVHDTVQWNVWVLEKHAKREGSKGKRHTVKNVNEGSPSPAGNPGMSLINSSWGNNSTFRRIYSS